MTEFATLQRPSAGTQHRPAGAVAAARRSDLVQLAARLNGGPASLGGQAAMGPRRPDLMQLATELNAGSTVRQLQALADSRSAPSLARAAPVARTDAPIQLARRPARPLRQALLASSALSPVQMAGGSWWGALGGAALGLGAIMATGGLAAVPTLGGLAVTAGGALLGRQAVIESGNLARAVTGGTHQGTGLLSGLTEYQTGPTEPGTLEGFLPGASRHKQVTDHVFNKLTGPGAHPSMDTERSFVDRQGAINVGGPRDPDAKLRNDVYVAHVMADHDMMREAARFCLSMAQTYGTGGARADVIRGRALEMTHLWPDQNLTGSLNQTYRGWTPVVSGLPRLVAGKAPTLTGAAVGLGATLATGGLAAVPTMTGFGAAAVGAGAGRLLGGLGGDPNRLATALAANIPTLRQLAAKRTAYTPEETAYILRAMGQLRDVMKPEKGRVRIAGGPAQPGLIRATLDGGKTARFPNAPDVKPTGRIRVSGAGAGGLGRDTPAWHDWSRGLNRKLVPFAAPYYHGTPPYEIQGREGRGARGGAQGSFDFLMGTSGTTLDMLNFFLAQGKTADEAARLMQVFYANWHKVAPDGNAHSQSESIGTMTQYLYGQNLKRPIMVPIQGEGDVADDAHQTYFSPLTEDDPGYLVGGRRARRG